MPAVDPQPDQRNPHVLTVRVPDVEWRTSAQQERILADLRACGLRLLSVQPPSEGQSDFILWLGPDDT